MFIQMVTHTGFKTGPTLAVWSGQGLLLFTPLFAHSEARGVTTSSIEQHVHGLQCALRKRHRNCF